MVINVHEDEFLEKEEYLEILKSFVKKDGSPYNQNDYEYDHFYALIINCFNLLKKYQKLCHDYDVLETQQLDLEQKYIKSIDTIDDLSQMVYAQVMMGELYE